MSARGRVVLTTGANSGLGLATAIEAARRGFESVGTVRSAAKAEIVRIAARASGVSIETVMLDIDDAEACAKVIDDVRPWGLVNNAAFVTQQRVEDVDDDEARRHLETLVVAPIRLARLALPHMRDGGSGRIVQISSISGRVSFPLLGWYQGAKAALEGVSDALRMEVAGQGIAVSIVEPGVFDSPVTDELGAMQWMRAWMSSAEEVAGVVVDALCARAPRARYVVGADAKLNAYTAPFTPALLRDTALRLLYGL